MGREIKFRAWNKKAHKMIDPQKATPLAVHPDLLKDGLKGLFLPFHEDVILMQDTGLRDAKRTREFPKGQPIYEGDVIEGNLFDRRIPTKGKVVYDHEHACYGNKNDAGITPLPKIAEIKVVGNVHENPGLLHDGI